jgi:hypothetical protein
MNNLEQDPLAQLFARKIYDGEAGEVWATGTGTETVFHANLKRYGKQTMTYRHMETRAQGDLSQPVRELAWTLLDEARKTE